MENKKLNIFTLFLVLVMCAFSIYISTNSNKGINGKDGKDGTDGKDFSILAMYQEYKAQYSSYTGTYDDFISDYLGDKLDYDDETTKASLSAQLALCSTVDICYSYSMDSYYTTTGGLTYFNGSNRLFYLLNESQKPLMSIAAGSGVIYQMDTSSTVKTAYIITNFHVAYIAGYSNNEDYAVVYNQSTGEYLSIEKSYINSQVVSFITKYTYVYQDQVETAKAPLETHFLDSYTIYLNGYQQKDYALTASFVGGSSEYDIAVLKVEYDSVNDSGSNNAILFNGNYRAAEIKDSDKTNKHDYVIPVGNPLIPSASDIDMTNIQTYDEYLSRYEEAYINSLCLTTTGGRVSEESYYCDFSSVLDSTKTIKMRLIQVDAAINPGNSGGGLFDLDGNLIGIVNGKVVDSNYDNVGYAIPINIATRVADQLIENCDGNTNVSISVATMKSLGLSVKEVAGINKPSFALGGWTYAYDLTVSKDIEATSVLYGKLQKDDIIKSIKFEGETTAHEVTLEYQINDLMLLAQKPQGASTTKVIFEINRAGTISNVEVELFASNFVLVK